MIMVIEENLQDFIIHELKHCLVRLVSFAVFLWDVTQKSAANEIIVVMDMELTAKKKMPQNLYSNDMMINDRLNCASILIGFY